VGDRSGRVRDASNALGHTAISIDIESSESTVPGFHYQGDALAISHGSRWERAFTFLPSEQQALSLGLDTAATMALDDRMFDCIKQWLRGWCIRAKCLMAETRDGYASDFHDAPYMRTNLADSGSERNESMLLFVRGAPFPRPTHAHHHESQGSNGGSARAANTAWAHAQARNETPAGFAHELALQVQPDGTGAQPQFVIEIERFAAGLGLRG